MGFVIGYLKKDEQYKTLASVAQCSQGLYELAILKLYETITVTKDNQDMLVNGHSLDPSCKSYVVYVYSADDRRWRQLEREGTSSERLCYGLYS
jgi:hypothetical protein